MSGIHVRKVRAIEGVRGRDVRVRHMDERWEVFVCFEMGDRHRSG
jgi:hypothetical protein